MKYCHLRPDAIFMWILDWYFECNLVPDRLCFLQVMEKELVELFERVKKAADAAVANIEADSSPEEDRCLDALKRLKGLPINYDVLVSTQVL